MTFFFKTVTILFLFEVLIFHSVFAADLNSDFETWLVSYKKNALKECISQETVDIAFKNVKFLEQVIRYDRKQPEFFEDTATYIGKRATPLRARKAKELLKKNSRLFSEVENKFMVEKEILLALWVIETNFGKHV